MAERWDPYKALGAHPEVELERVDMSPNLYAKVGGSMYVVDDDCEAILLDRRLDRAERREGVAHEVIHKERGIPCRKGLPTFYDPVWARQEASIEDEVARRLVPLAQLRWFVDRQVAEHASVTALDVAERFEVTEQLAARAMSLLRRDRLGHARTA